MDIVIGRNPTLEVLKGEREVKQIFLAAGSKGKSIERIIRLAKGKRIPVEYIERKALEQKAGSSSHQGVLAYVEEYSYTSPVEIVNSAREAGRVPLIIILDQIQDPHNLGSIIRTAHALGADGIIISSHRSCGITPAVTRTSAGAVEHIPVAQVTNINQTIDQLKEMGIWIYGAEADGEQKLYATDLTGPLALVIGSEGKGLRRLVREKCDFLINIPLGGKINSLNASVAAGILIYEVIRQRTK